MGAPVRLRIPTKLGFKSAKNVRAISVTNTYPGGYWEDQATTGFRGRDALRLGESVAERWISGVALDVLVQDGSERRSRKVFRQVPTA
jgi:DMSO/TMAO reductase YedYZ molybdopterin-dependent catalytic subunit